MDERAEGATAQQGKGIHFPIPPRPPEMDPLKHYGSIFGFPSPRPSRTTTEGEDSGGHQKHSKPPVQEQRRYQNLDLPFLKAQEGEAWLPEVGDHYLQQIEEIGTSVSPPYFETLRAP